MARRVPATVIIGATALMVGTVAAAAIGWRASRSTIEAGVWWDDASFALTESDAAKIGGSPMTGVDGPSGWVRSTTVTSPRTSASTS